MLPGDHRLSAANAWPSKFGARLLIQGRWGAAQVVGVTDDVVAVSKPATWSVHATGQHRKNTVAGVLEATRPDLGTLHPVHRLDKPVSGLLLFARHPASADALRTLIQVRFPITSGI